VPPERLPPAVGCVDTCAAAWYGSRSVAMSPQPFHLELYSRSGCHLCEELRALCDRLGGEFPLRLTELNVDADPALAARYGAEVPVLFIDGRKAVKFRTTEAAFRRMLQRRRLLRQLLGA